jgi:hypothetical protein
VNALSKERALVEDLPTENWSKDTHTRERAGCPAYRLMSVFYTSCKFTLPLFWSSTL